MPSTLDPWFHSREINTPNSPLVPFIHLSVDVYVRGQEGGKLYTHISILCFLKHK